jgi:biopolymer transport protein ExbB
MRRRLAPVAALAAMVWLAVIAAPARGQADGTAPDAATLRDRLADLEAQIERERQALAERRDRHEQALAEQRSRRRALAAEAVRLELERQDLQRESNRLDEQLEAAAEREAAASAAWRRVRDSIRLLADQAELYAGELPGGGPVAARIQEASDDLADGHAVAGYSALAEAVDELDAGAQDVRLRAVDLRTASGKIERVALLSVGHIAFAYRIEDRIGLAFASPADADGYRWHEDLSGDLREQWASAFAAMEGGGAAVLDMPLDVTGRLRAEAAVDERTLVDYFASGGPVMWPLVGVAGLCLVMLGERAWTLYVRNGGDTTLAGQVEAAIRQGAPERAADLARQRRTTAGRTIAALLDRREAGQHAMEDSVQEQLLYELPRLQRFLRGIGILAAVAPLLGLLGTVTGIINTFTVIRTVGNTAPGLMAGGISEALLTTATGLSIAIPVLLLNGVMRGRVDRLIAEAEEQAASVLNVLAHDQPALSPRSEAGDE